jgi:hypothetical protein
VSGARAHLGAGGEVSDHRLRDLQRLLHTRVVERDLPADAALAPRDALVQRRDLRFEPALHTRIERT